MEQLIDETQMGRQKDAKDVILKLGCESFGDSLCSTPTLRKLAKSYGKKIIVCSYKPFIFENNPYVKFHIDVDDFKEEFREQYEVLETFFRGGHPLGVQGGDGWSNGVKLKYGSVDIRKIHCVNLGFDLRPNEMHCEYHPGPINFEESDESFLNSGGYIVIHICKTWPSRTWSKSNYENLIANINKAGYKVALIGFDQLKEPGDNNYDKSCYNFEDFVFEGVSFLNRTSLDQDFEIIKKANICITCDTGILHLSGCTDTEIIYIGGSIDPALRAPYRHGGQDYKFSFVGGECKIFCGSDIKYCITEHAELNSLPLIAECLEKKPTFECHPTHEQVFKKIAEVNLRNLGEAAAPLLPLQAKKGGNLKRVLVDIGSSALGDSLAWIAYVEEYRLKNNYEVYCSTFRNELYEKSYPEINFIKPGGIVHSCNEVINIGWGQDEETGEIYPPLDIRHRGLQETASFCLGLEDHVERKPKIHIEDKERKTEGKYVCISVQSTNQAKHWNNKGGWNKVVEYLKLLGYKVLCIDKEYDDTLEGAINRTSISMQETIADIYNCEFFVGLTSGLSWLSWALGKEVILISGFTDPKTEFYTPYRLINRDVCNSCWNKEEFDKVNWNWCPYHEGTEREFECTKEITFEDVRKEIDKAINFVGLKEKGQKKVLVEFDSWALGDSIAWIPYVEKYRLKNNYEVYCSTYKNELFEKKYPEINFIKPGDTVEGDCDVIKIGWTKDEETGELYPPLDIRHRGLQETASFCLGLEDHIEIKPEIHIENKERQIEGKYVCISVQSTAQAKYWNNKEGWGKVVKYLKLLGYKVVCIDKDSQFGKEGQYNYIPKGVIDKTKENSENTSLQDRITDLHNCEFFIGLPSGLSWLAWALDKEVIMISGFSDPKTEFHTPYRLINRDVCNSCWNKEEFDRGNWNWCPYHEGTEREFECTKKITFEDVKEQMDRAINFIDLKKKGQVTFDGLTQNILKLGDRAGDLLGLDLQWQEIFMGQIYETLSPVEKGDVVLDIGANVGFFTAFAMWRGASKCYSIEPIPCFFELLYNWIKTSKDRDKLFPINEAISDKPVRISLEEARLTMNHWKSVRLEHFDADVYEKDYIELDAIKLSDFFKKHPSENFDFIKMDCEGGEWSVLNNEKELDILIKKTKKLAMEIHLRLTGEPKLDFNFDFVDRFIDEGFDIKFTSVDGEDITSRILNNEKRSDGQLFHDYYWQVMFFAQKK